MHIPSSAIKAAISGVDMLDNLSIAATVGSNILTVTVNAADGSALSPGNPGRLAFRSATAGTGTPVYRRLTSSPSMTVSVGSTLGHVSAVSHYIYVYLIDVGGTIQVGVSSVMFDEGVLQDVTTEGGAGGADLNRLIYTSSGASARAIRLIGRMLSNQTTAGTWAAVPTQISLVPWVEQLIMAKYTGPVMGGNTALANATLEVIDYDTKIIDTHNAVATGGAWAFTAPRAGIYRVQAACQLESGGGWADNELFRISVHKNGGAEDTILGASIQQAATVAVIWTGGETLISLAAADAINIQGYQDSGGGINFRLSGIFNHVTIQWVSPA